MIMKRRHKRHIHHKAREFIWPSMGWRRTFRYFKLRILRLQDHPKKIARGIASGVSVCFTPLPFTHFIQSVLLAALTRGNVLAALIVSWIGNPWTYPFMWWAAYKVGVYTFGQVGWDVPDLPSDYTFEMFWDVLRTDPIPLMLPWIVGGYIMTALSWVAVYFISTPIVAAAQGKRLTARAHARQNRKKAGSL
jgi:uncharacterized protein (DUF2062 family)